tara:strand:+ start:3143 stop:4366 length:1224 start_codon:yes stop_codon:yes gene_type:complete
MLPRTTSQSQILAISFAFIALLPIAALNSTIFSEDNLVFLLGATFLFGLFSSKGRLYAKSRYPWVSLWFIALLAYSTASAWFTSSSVDAEESELMKAVDLLMYFLLFKSTVSATTHTNQDNQFLWWLIVGYSIAFVLRNSVDIAGLQQGYNLSPGFVLMTFVPLILLPTLENGQARYPRGGVLLALTFVFWLALIGARTAAVSIMLLLALIWVWPILVSRRWIYICSFWGAVGVMVLFYWMYLHLSTGLDESLVEDSSFNFFRKRLGTRTDIWLQLLYLISQNPWFGYGLEASTHAASPVQSLDFSYHRDNLASHSTYLEIVYRLGIIGLGMFILILYSIWMSLWYGRTNWKVRVVGAYLLTLLFFASTGQFLFLTDMSLRSGFAWMVLAIGVGVSLKYKSTNYAQA